MLLSSTIVVVIFHDEIYECSGRQHALNGPFPKKKHAFWMTLTSTTSKK